MSGYSNISVKGPSRQALIEYLSREKAVTYVSPSENGYTVVYPFDPFETLEGCAAGISEHFQCPALAVVEFDDDIWLYWLYDNGLLKDEYNSDPSYGENVPRMPPSGGNAHILCAVLGAEGFESQVEKILRHQNDYTAALPIESFKMSSDLHADLVDLLGLPSCSVNTSHEYIEYDDEPGGLSRADFIATP